MNEGQFSSHHFWVSRTVWLKLLQIAQSCWNVQWLSPQRSRLQRQLKYGLDVGFLVDFFAPSGAKTNGDFPAGPKAAQTINEAGF